MAGGVVPDPTADPTALRDELDQLALAGGGYARVLSRLAAAVGRRLRFTGADGRLLIDTVERGEDPHLDHVASEEGGLTAPVAAQAFTGGAGWPVTCSDGAVGRAHPVLSGSRRVGLVVVLGPEPAPRERALVGAAVTALGIEGVRRDLRTQVEAESGAWLIGELRFGSRRSTGDLTALALRAGIDLEADHAALVLSHDGDDRTMWETSLGWLRRPVLVDGRRAWTVVGGRDGQSPAQEATYIRQRLAGFVTGEVRAALGHVVRSAADTRASFAVAARALALRPADEAVYEALDLDGLLLLVPPERLRTHVEHHLGPLLDHPDLLETLEAWLVTGGSRLGVARLVNLHRNSVGYRLDRVRSLLGTDPNDPLVARDLHAAFSARRVLDAIDHEGD